MVGQDACKILRDLCDPLLLKDRSYGELKEILEKQFAPRVSIFCHRIKFDKLQQEDETVNEWYVKVKRGAMQCKFGAILEERMKDKFVKGIKRGAVLDRLCEEPTSKISKELLEIGLNKEAASRHTIEVNKIRRNRGQGSWKTTEKKTTRRRDQQKSQETGTTTRRTVSGEEKKAKKRAVNIMVNQIMILKIVGIKRIVVRYVRK